MNILDTLEDIFSEIVLPQNLKKKVALVKSQIAAAEKNILKLEDQVIQLKEDLINTKSQNEKSKADHQRYVADLLNPEQGLSKPLPRVITKRSRHN